MRVAGLMSGTSVDAIDVAITEISGEGFDQQVQLLAFESIPFPPAVKQSVLAISNAQTHTARLSRMNVLLGELFAEAVLETCKRAGFPVDSLDLIGSHGQTVSGHPHWEFGDLSVIAQVGASPVGAFSSCAAGLFLLPTL